MKKILIIFISILSLTSCNNTSTNETKSEKVAILTNLKETNTLIISDSTFVSPYQFNSISQVFSLGYSLLEISGLSYFSAKNQLLAVNDEQGIIFVLNPNTGEVEDTYKHGYNGDFEGVEWFGEYIAVVKSNGNISFYNIDKKETEYVQKTKLKPSNDIEGLAFDALTEELLLACKGNPNLGKTDKYKKTKNIYRYNIKEEKILEEPYMSVKDKKLEKFVKKNSKDLDLSKSDIKDLKNRVKKFAPSGLAFHPQTRDLYLLSSSGKLVLIYNSNKDLTAIVFLDKKINRQPEGICFAPNGDLFISNEGNGLGAKLMKYAIDNE